MVSGLDQIIELVQDRMYPCFIRPILVAWFGFGYRHGKWYFVRFKSLLMIVLERPLANDCCNEYIRMIERDITDIRDCGKPGLHNRTAQTGKPTGDFFLTQYKSLEFTS